MRPLRVGIPRASVSVLISVVIRRCRCVVEPILSTAAMLSDCAPFAVAVAADNGGSIKDHEKVLGPSCAWPIAATLRAGGSEHLFLLVAGPAVGAFESQDEERFRCGKH